METVRLFTDLIRFELCGKAVSHPPLSVEEAKALFLLAKKHDLAHVAANGAIRAGLLPDDPRVQEVYKKACLSALVRYESLAKELVLITALFEEAKIVHLPLKGSVLRAIYPAPWMRSSCDIDILVHEEDIERARPLLLEAGYRPYANTAHDVSFDSPRGVHIELHFRLLEDGVSAVMQETLNGVWSYASPREGRVYEQMLSDDFFYYYHIAHMAKHYLHGGCGIRPFLDLHLLRHTAHDRAARTALLTAGGLCAFDTHATALADVWFGDGTHTPVTEEMERYVISGGVYGTEENRITVGQTRRGGKLGYALSRIFLPYHALKYHYPSLQKHKWLFPFFQVRRWCKLIFLGGIRRSAKELETNRRIDGDKASATARHLGELGL